LTRVKNGIWPHIVPVVEGASAVQWETHLRAMGRRLL